jgi:hypothetical protein
VTPLRFHICNCAHSVFDEVEACLVGSLRRLGHTVTHERGIFVTDDDVINISLGVFDIPADMLADMRQLIVYNFEQIGAETIAPIRQTYFRVMRNAFVWEYSLPQLETLRQSGITQSAYVPLAYAPEIVSSMPTPPEHEDVDVLFYGALSERRLRIFDALESRGIRVTYPTDGQATGLARNELIARAKIVLNLGNFQDIHTLEIVRLAPWFVMGKAILTELRENTHWDRSLDGAFMGVPYDEIVDACANLLADDSGRRALGERAKAIFRRKLFDDSVKQGVAAYLTARAASAPRGSPSTNVAPPERLNYATLNDWTPTALNISPDSADDPDMVIDLSRPIEFGKSQKLWRYGDYSLAPATFTSIRTQRAFATGAEVMSVVANFGLLLQRGGELLLTLPYAPQGVPQWVDIAGGGCLAVDELFFDLWSRASAEHRCNVSLIQVTHNLNIEAFMAFKAGRGTLADFQKQANAISSITFLLRKAG